VRHEEFGRHGRRATVAPDRDAAAAAAGAPTQHAAAAAEARVTDRKSIAAVGGGGKPLPVSLGDVIEIRRRPPRPLSIRVDDFTAEFRRTFAVVGGGPLPVLIGDVVESRRRPFPVRVCDVAAEFRHTPADVSEALRQLPVLKRDVIEIRRRPRPLHAGVCDVIEEFRRTLDSALRPFPVSVCDVVIEIRRRPRLRLPRGVYDVTVEFGLETGNNPRGVAERHEPAAGRRRRK